MNKKTSDKEAPTIYTSYSESPEHVVSAYQNLGQKLQHIDPNTKYWNWEVTGYLSNASLARIFALEKIYLKILKLHGSVIELGCHSGATSILLSNFRSLFEPYNNSREFHLFDTFTGFPENQSDSDLDQPLFSFELKDNYKEHLENIISSQNIIQSNSSRSTNIQVHAGNIKKTFPDFKEKNPHTLIALALVDLDQFSITKFAIENLESLLRPGSLVVFSGANCRNTPGVNKAIEGTFLKKYEIKKDLNLPYLGYIEIV
jgi:hypothetical protein